MQIDLVGLGLAAKWPKLRKLEEDRANFQRRHRKAEAEANALTAQVSRARSADLDAEAAAVRQGRKPPEPTREAAAKQALEAAIRERDVLARTVQAIEGEFGAFMAQHQRGLFSDVLKARHKVAVELADHARACLAHYTRWADLARTVKDLTPAEPVVEGLPAQRLTQSFALMHTTPRGLNRGDIEGVLAHLAHLAPEPQEHDDDAAA